MPEGFVLLKRFRVELVILLRLFFELGGSFGEIPLQAVGVFGSAIFILGCFGGLVDVMDDQGWGKSLMGAT